MRHGSAFDLWSSALVVVGYAVPGFLFAIVLIVLFAGGSYLDWFPLRGLASEGAERLGPLARFADYLWHLALPVGSLVVGGFASLTLLTKNSFLDEISRQYVATARAKAAQRAPGALRPCVPQRHVAGGGRAAGRRWSRCSSPGRC